MATERECFLNAILDNPEEDIHRLVYADWLQERDGELLAMLIRPTWKAREIVRELDITPSENINDGSLFGAAYSSVRSLELSLEIDCRQVPEYAHSLPGFTFGPVVGVDDFGARWICPRVMAVGCDDIGGVWYVSAASRGTYTRIASHQPLPTLIQP